MSEIKTEFLETSADFKVESLPLSHVSVEIGHLYMEDFVGRRGRCAAQPSPPRRRGSGPRRSRRPSAATRNPSGSAPASSSTITSAGSRRRPKLIPMVLAAAEREGVGIDYLARESACASANGVSPASLTLGSLVTEPVPGTTGGRPPLPTAG